MLQPCTTGFISLWKLLFSTIVARFYKLNVESSQRKSLAFQPRENLYLRPNSRRRVNKKSPRQPSKRETDELSREGEEDLITWVSTECILIEELWESLNEDDVGRVHFEVKYLRSQTGFSKPQESSLTSRDTPKSDLSGRLLDN